MALVKALLFSLAIGPFFGFPLADSYRDFAGNPIYGFDLSLRYQVNERFSMGLLTGAAFSSREDELGLPIIDGAEISNESYTQVVTGYQVPFQVTGTFYTLPGERFNPYLGVGLGGSYAGVAAKARDLPGNADVSEGDLTDSESDFLFAFSPYLGCDVEISRHVGVYLEARYNYLSSLKFERDVANPVRVGGAREAPTVTEKRDIEMFNVGGSLGVRFRF
ncbi:MAG: outer membrane beta-barrel protein [Candidatus Lernaella stagnicola]|nr:outer membrane beta-barrel protein [Candidatus Lernaella stagnicola]